MRIAFVHLLNDYSGSPKILASVIKHYAKAGYQIDIFTSGKNRSGFLSNLEVNYYYFPYKFCENKYVRLISFTISQIFLFLMMFRYLFKRDTLIYINTMLPFGAGLAAKILGLKLVYHVHESYISPASFKAFLKKVIKISAERVFYVSDYLRKVEYIDGVESVVVPNALDNEFLSIASKHDYKAMRLKDQFNVLLVSSLKTYKGIDQFVKLATRLGHKANFELVINADRVEIDEYFSKFELPSSLTIYSRQSNLDPFYKRASLVLNLSLSDQVIETFGLTILEAMAYGIPVIAPPVGGPTELVKPLKNGFLVDARDIDKLAEKVELLIDDPIVCNIFSGNGKQRAACYDEQKMLAAIDMEVNALISASLNIAVS